MNDTAADRDLPIVLLIGYAVVVGLIACSISHSSRAPSTRLTDFEYRVARDLPLNHRILGSDLQIPPVPPTEAWEFPSVELIKGRYLAHRVSRGQAISRNDVLQWPAMPPADKVHEIISMPVPTDLNNTEAVDADQTVILGTDSKDCIRGRVIAVVCSLKGTDQWCNAWLLIEINDSSRLAEGGNVKWNLIVQAEQ